MKYIVGCDISLNAPGFALLKIEDGKAFLIRKSVVNNKKIKTEDMPLKLEHTRRELTRYLGDDFEYARESSFTKGNRATQAIFRIVGVLEESLWSLTGKKFYSYAPTTIKLAITGDGKASKEKVEECLEQYVGKHEYVDDNESDAVAVALTHAIKMCYINGGRKDEKVL